MNDNNSLKFRPFVVWMPAIFVVIIWGVYWFEIQFDYNFNKFGVLPRELTGLRGIFLSHFIHSNTSHLFNNSIPLFALSAALFFFYREVAAKLLIYGILLSGFFTWLIARDSYHIGASGVVYLLFSFIFFSGILKRHFRLIAVSLIAIFLYGSMVWFIFPTEDTISWEGHLSGFIVGLLFSIFYRKKGMIREEYEFSKTDFDLLFDENGNLIENETEEN